MSEYNEKGAEKQKFKVGDLVRGSSCLNCSYYSIWTEEELHRPYGRKRVTGNKRWSWCNTDVGIITRIAKPGTCQNYYVEVRFLQSGDTVILTQRQLKWARK